MKKFFLITLFMSLSLASFGKDLTSVFEKNYRSGQKFPESETTWLKHHDVVLVPGVLAEVLVWEDRTIPLNFSYLTSDYFGDQLQYFKNLGLNVSRLPTSTKSVKQTQDNIAHVLQEAKLEGKKIFFVTHSLGGLALLDYLLEYPAYQKQVLGIVFFQVPFHGAPLTQFFLKNPLRTLMSPVMPFLNFSYETIRFLSPASRAAIMTKNEKALQRLIQTVPMLTISGVANGTKTIFRPAVEMVEFGCPVNAFGRCISPVFYPGPYDLSDGMVPLKSSKLSNVDSIELKGVDHGEIVVNMPFMTYQRQALTEAVMNVFFSR